MPAISSRNSHVRVDTTLLLATKWTVEIRADEIDVTTFESGGFTQQLTGYIDATITFDAFWDCDLNIFEDPPEIAPGTTHILRCYISGAPGGIGTEVPVGAAVLDRHFRFPCARCVSMNVTSAVRDAVRFDGTFRNNGKFYYPDSIVIPGGADCTYCSYA